MTTVFWILYLISFGLFLAGMGKLVRSATRVCPGTGETAVDALGIGLVLCGGAVALVGAVTRIV